jgi:hypothetical protein
MAKIKAAKSERAASKLLKAARALAAYGDPADAVKYYQRIIKKYPGTKSEKFASEEIGAMKEAAKKSGGDKDADDAEEEDASEDEEADDSEEEEESESEEESEDEE